MSDQVTAPTPVVAPATPVAPSPAPVVAPTPAPVAAPVVAEAAPAPVVEPTPVAEPKPAEVVTPKAAELVESLFEAAGKKIEPIKADEKKDEPKVDGDPKEVVTTEPVDAPVEYKFEFPEGIQADEKQLQPFTEILRENKIAPETAQKFMGLHIDSLKAYAQHIQEHNAQAWAETTNKWREEVTADDQIGGSGHKTAMDLVAQARDRFVPQSDKAGLSEFLRLTGAGNNKYFLRMMARVGKAFQEPAPLAPTTPPADRGPAPKSRRSSLYDHDSSKKAGTRR